jgi:hypothetical protein
MRNLDLERDRDRAEKQIQRKGERRGGGEERRGEEGRQAGTEGARE